MEKYGSTLPEDIVSLIALLNKSQDDKDRTVAVILSTVSIEPINTVFQCIFEKPELLKVIIIN